MDELVQSVAYGLVAGSRYALVAIGYSLIYSVLGFVNFSHGEMLTVGAYLGWFFGVGSLGLPLPLAALGATVGAAVCSFLAGRFIFLPARRRSSMTALVTAIAVSVFLQGVITLGFTSDAQPFYSSLNAGSLAGSAIGINTIHLLGFAVIIALLIVVRYVFLERTSLGVEIRACASNPRAGFLWGLRRTRVFGIVFLLSGALAGLAGIFVALDDRIITPTMGFGLGLRAFIASVVGGIRNFHGAVLGAFVLGLTENLVTFVFLKVPFLVPLAPIASKDAVALGLLVVVLLRNPTGLTGVRYEARP